MARLLACIAVALLCAGCSLDLTGLLPRTEQPLASPMELRLEPGTDSASFEVSESRADLSRAMRTLSSVCSGCPAGMISSVSPASFRTDGNTPVAVTVTVSREGLAAGEHTAYVYAATESNGLTGSEPNGAVFVAVTVVVGPAAEGSR